MALLDATIVTVALPDMQAGLGAGITGAQWIVDAYAVCLAAFTLSGGALGDRGMIVAGAVVLAAAALLALPWSHRTATTQPVQEASIPG
jgi:MFS family permease